MRSPGERTGRGTQAAEQMPGRSFGNLIDVHCSNNGWQGRREIQCPAAPARAADAARLCLLVSGRRRCPVASLHRPAIGRFRCAFADTIHDALQRLIAEIANLGRGSRYFAPCSLPCRRRRFSRLPIRSSMAAISSAVAAFVRVVIALLLSSLQELTGKVEAAAMVPRGRAKQDRQQSNDRRTAMKLSCTPLRLRRDQRVEKGEVGACLIR